jgi:hypothetical protein
MERKRRPTPVVKVASPSTTYVGKIQWKKMGGGFLRLPNRIIKPGDIFWASINEIPSAFRDQIIPLDINDLKKGEDKPAEEIIPEVVSLYTKVQRPDTNWYDIFDAQNKRVNEKALREDQVDDYLKSLQG